MKKDHRFFHRHALATNTKKNTWVMFCLRGANYRAYSCARLPFYLIHKTLTVVFIYYCESMGHAPHAKQLNFLVLHFENVYHG